VVDKVALKGRLAKAEEHAAKAAQCAARQRTLIAELSSKGLDTLEARLMLAQFEQIQELRTLECYRLREQIRILA
jgi:hypothetical protein